MTTIYEAAGGIEVFVRLAEALGGPATYTAEWGGSESHVQRLHAGEGDYAVEAGPRFAQCVVDSFDEAGVPYRCPTGTGTAPPPLVEEGAQRPSRNPSAQTPGSRDGRQGAPSTNDEGSTSEE